MVRRQIYIEQRPGMKKSFSDMVHRYPETELVLGLSGYPHSGESGNHIQEYCLQCRVYEGITGLESQASMPIQGMTEVSSVVG